MTDAPTMQCLAFDGPERIAEDPLQYVFELLDVVIQCRGLQKPPPDPDGWSHLLGEMDYTVELHRALEAFAGRKGGCSQLNIATGPLFDSTDLKPKVAAADRPAVRPPHESGLARTKGIGGHTLQGNGRHKLWLTPPQLLAGLGPFDLDPCACPEPRPWATAKRHIALPEDGLKAGWFGRVWLNPPYGTKIGAWMKRMALYSERSGLALTFARTDTGWWRRWVWPFAHSVLFLSGRLNFYLPDGTRSAYNAGGPSALISYSLNDTDLAALIEDRRRTGPSHWQNVVRANVFANRSGC